MPRPLLPLLARWHARHPHVHDVGGWPVAVFPGVFDPVMTKVGLWLSEIAPAYVRPGERWLELGTGSGIVAAALARAGARVSASDLDETAARNARFNAALSEVEVDVRVGDLFAPWSPPAVPGGGDGGPTVVAPGPGGPERGGVGRPFDVIVANLPFWPGTASDLPIGHAFGAGERFELLRRFVAEAPAFAPTALLALSENFSAFAEARAAIHPAATLLRRDRFRGEWLNLFVIGERPAL